jgi:hypothetical protein
MLEPDDRVRHGTARRHDVRLIPKVLFGLGVKSSAGRASISEKSAPVRIDAANVAPAATSFRAMEPSSRLRLPKDSRVPLPVIGVRRVLMQGGAHDGAPCHDPSRNRRALPARGPFGTVERAFLQGGGVSADSWTPGRKCRFHRHRTGPRPSGLSWTHGGRVGTTDAVHPLRARRRCGSKAGRTIRARPGGTVRARSR